MCLHAVCTIHHHHPHMSMAVPGRRYTCLQPFCCGHACHMPTCTYRSKRNRRLSEKRELMRDRTQHKVEILVALDARRRSSTTLQLQGRARTTRWLAACCILYVKPLYTCPVSEVAGRPGVASFKHLLVISCWHDMVGSPHQTAPVLAAT